MNIKAIVFDVDKTLFDHKTSTYTKSSIDAIKILKEKGYKLYVATSRSYDSLLSINFPIDLPFDGIYSYNGNVYIDKNGIKISRLLDKDEVKKAIEISKKHDICMQIVNCNETYICTKKNHKFLEHIKEFMEADIVEKEYENEDVLGIVFNMDKEEEILFKNLKGFWNRYGKFAIELTNKENLKSEAILDIMKRDNLKKEEIMCFGDSYYDESMFKACGYSIAMGNATDKIKSLASEITETIEEHGIYNSLKRNGLI